ncbi:MAG TPA: hypothetical protein VMI72_16730 [Roseiarcus sp.]|nr:hypothetical protein [Roseiarcus sp.]
MRTLAAAAALIAALDIAAVASPVPTPSSRLSGPLGRRTADARGVLVAGGMGGGGGGMGGGGGGMGAGGGMARFGSPRVTTVGPAPWEWFRSGCPPAAPHRKPETRHATHKCDFGY